MYSVRMTKFYSLCCTYVNFLFTVTMIPHPMGILYPWNPFLVTECRWTISGIVTPVIVQVFVSTTSGLASVNHLGSHLQLVAG